MRAPVAAEDLLLEIIVAEGWFPDLTHEELVEKCASWSSVFLKRLVDDLNDRRVDSQHARYDFNSSTDTLIQGACFAEPNDSESVKQAKARRANHGLYTQFLRSVSPREFEAVCKGVLSLFGCDRPVLTRPSNDQGIDFHGLLSLRGKLNQEYFLPSIDKNLNIWLVGQAKHYEGVASTPELRELAGSVALARAGVSADDGSALASLRIRVFDPVFYLFLTTGELSADSRRLSRRSGIIVMDGDALAEFLADNEIGVVNDVFELHDARDWIALQLSDTSS
ncbi:restriction endonuclease [Paenarthrobacter aurescens]|uniref:restriction endonuclease n=1 Tax=Paenarthrobacter aurescens TaxID=43663 RepID=UPI0014777EAC|nr:restriction endonuclease [Paenarthrobacter aurescens]MDO6143368.1 restriction endonuclease [Paenarthrobacter aurescens]MDO6147216.1 restriction endonuclease [Paenarthrobacter aurescens]MDO6158460.1 restriction endonuclease [Paenarthrobacter aurescens]MDO6162444.1 restriction endonuclease [Paenarthrobacter aurescens]